MENNSREKEASGFGGASFSYTYSAKQRDEIKRIRDKYERKEPDGEDNLERLRRLDASVTKKASMISIIVGVIGTLMLGIGMSIIMTEMNVPAPVGIAVGSLGIAVLGAAYPIYTHMAKKEREKLAPEILRITDELMK